MRTLLAILVRVSLSWSAITMPGPSAPTQLEAGLAGFKALPLFERVARRRRAEPQGREPRRSRRAVDPPRPGRRRSATGLPQDQHHPAVACAEKERVSSHVTCMGLFLSSGCFWVLLPVLCSERERPFFIPSPAIRFPERAEGSRDRNASNAWRLCRLASLVFRSAPGLRRGRL